MLTEDNTFDFLRQVNGLESAVNTFYNYFRNKNIQIDASYINYFDKIINADEPDEFFPNELLLNYEKIYNIIENLNKEKEINEQIIPNFKNYEDNIETESKVRHLTIDTKTKDLSSKINNRNNRNNRNNVNYVNYVNTKFIAINKKYSCKKCGKLYIHTDGVRKHWKNKHSEFELKRGNIHDYTTIIQTEETDNSYKANESPDNIELTCNESL